jgi:hypothetical protein
MSERGLKIESWNIERIKPYELNVKIHDDKQVSKIAASIKKFGWQGSPILVDKNGVIVAGHGRRLAAIKLDMKTLPVAVLSDLSEDEVSAFRLADNRVSIGDTDTDLLEKVLSGLNYDLEDIFDKKELDFAVANLGEMNLDPFESDLAAVMSERGEETSSKIKESAAKRVPIQKALGFDSIDGANAIHITRFMAQLEGLTMCAAEESFVSFCKSETEDNK